MAHKLQNKIKYKTYFFYNEKALGLLATISLCLLEKLHRSGFEPRSCLINPQKETIHPKKELSYLYTHQILS